MGEFFMARLLGNVIISGKIRTLTGLHIGGSSEGLSIGGMDLPVIRNPQDMNPYIPGSSLKGKLRMITEFMEGKYLKSDGKVVEDKESCAAQIFGVSPGDDASASKGTIVGPTRLLVRDAFPDEYTTAMWQNLDTELLFTENKSENTIDRITSKANPRSVERVVPGSCFDFEMIFSIYDFDGIKAELVEANHKIPEDVDNLKFLFSAMRLLQDSTLGGHGSRGYGHIEFHLSPELQFITKDDYILGSSAAKRNVPGALNELIPLNEFPADQEIEKIRSKQTELMASN